MSPVRDALDGEPLDTAIIRYIGAGMSAWVEADALGTYTITGVAGTYDVWGVAPPLPDTNWQKVTVPPSRSNVDFTFQAYSIRGTVRDQRGWPIANANVSTSPGDPMQASAATAANGTYRLRVKPGAYRVMVGRSPFVNPPPQAVTVPPSQTGVDFSFLIYTIAGTVRDGAGLTLAGAMVSTISGDPMQTSVVSGADGSYLLQVITGTYHVRATLYGATTPPTQTVTVPPNAAGVDFAFADRYTIRGVVHDYDGTPLANALVNTDYYHDPAYIQGYTAAAGNYALIVPAGTYHVKAQAYGLLSPSAQTIVAPPSRANVDFTFPERYTISGVVRDYGGAPLQYVQVSTHSGDSVQVSTSTNASGVYTLTVIAGSYTIVASKYSNAMDPPARAITVPPSQSGVDFTFPTRYTITGTVRDYDGEPLQDVSVRATSGPISDSDWTSADGLYSLTVISGTYTLEVSKSGYPSPARQTVTVPPSRANADFTFPERYTISGVVRDYDGAPLQYQRVSTRSSDPVQVSTSTNASGVYTLTVIAGSYTVVVDKYYGAMDPPDRAVTVPPSQSGVDFTFPARYTITGTVRYYDGAPLSDVSVQAYGGLVSDSDTTGADGLYSLTVVSGTYTLAASKSGYASPPRQQVAAPPSRADVDFTFVQH